MLHYFIFALDCAFFRLFYSIRGFSEPLKKEQRKQRKKGRRIPPNVNSFKSIYNTLESQIIFVRGFRPKTLSAGAAYSTPQTSQLKLTHFAWVRPARLASTDPQIIFLYYPPGLKSSDDIRKKSAAPYMFDWVNTSLKRLKRFEDEAKVEQIIAIVTTHSVSFYSSCFVLAISLLNLILLQYDVMCAIHLLLLFIGKAPHESTKYSIYITTESVLVRYDGYLAKTLELFLLLQHFFFISNT